MNTRKMGANRGKRRLWLEGAILSAAGFAHGDRFEVHGDRTLVIERNPEGSRRIAGTPARPIVDINSDLLLAPYGNTGDSMAIANPEPGVLVIVNEASPLRAAIKG